MKRFFCWLTGGHKYNDKNQESAYLPKERKTLIANHCIKCGEKYFYLLDTDRLIQEEMERMKNRLSFLPLSDKRNNNLGICEGYSHIECPNCGRLRVEHFSSGLDICEKCNWCIQKNEYWSDTE